MKIKIEKKRLQPKTIAINVVVVAAVVVVVVTETKSGFLLKKFIKRKFRRVFYF